jgi:hypothetical protein
MSESGIFVVVVLIIITLLYKLIFGKDYSKKHKIFYITESCSVCGTDTIGYCKNCEEYSFHDHKAGYRSEHGEWKSISNSFKEHSGFNEQLRWRERKYGTPLPIIQKIKAARKVSHDLYPTEKYYGKRGHWIRERLRKDLLNSIGVNYKMKG